MQRFFIALLFLGFVRALLQNFTVDDTSPEISYSGETFQCNTNTCGPEITESRFNQTATLTAGNITFSFNGTAYYASIDLIGECTIYVDGNLIDTVLSEDRIGVQWNISNPAMANGQHTLVIAPNDNGIIGFDHLIYTASLPTTKSHVGAIVGGVVGGFVLTIGALFAAVLARRRKLIMRRNQRKSAVLRAITSARPDYKVGAKNGMELPT
ncbi:hypothetical protein B0H12DRAFT_1243449 [Mycena haematopus]|nr:hypothetical protein B0H12DRAFT_1243449 [Mycena haematopus]